MIEKMLLELPVLSVVIFALVAWLKQLGIKDQALTISSFVFGLVLGVCYRYASAPMVDFAGWFYAVLFGLLAGVVASGAYKAGQTIAGTDDKSLATANAAQTKQTAKIIAAVDAGAEKQTPQ
jgi:uncharacterized membrane-anchored protein YitT (DUF2179 family)